MQRMMAEVRECTGTFGDTPASEYDRHWCKQCQGSGWIIVRQPTPFQWIPRWWRGKTGRWASPIMAKRHGTE